MEEEKNKIKCIFTWLRCVFERTEGIKNPKFITNEKLEKKIIKNLFNIDKIICTSTRDLG